MDRINASISIVDGTPVSRYLQSLRGSTNGQDNWLTTFQASGKNTLAAAHKSPRGGSGKLVHPRADSITGTIRNFLALLEAKAPVQAPCVH
jgi:hypothetical protein